MTRSSTAAPILAVLAVVLVMYVGGYFLLAKESKNYSVSTASIASGLKLETIERRYPHKLLATVYAPVGRVEQYFRQTDVVLTFVGQFP